MVKSSPIPDLKQVEDYLYKPDNFRKLRTIIDLNLKPVDEHGEYLPWNQFKHLDPPKKTNRSRALVWSEKGTRKCIDKYQIWIRNISIFDILHDQQHAR